MRWPRTAAVLSVAVATTTPVTLREVTGVVVAGATAIGIRDFWGGGSPVGEPSLQEIAKFRKRKNLVRRRWVTVTADCGLAKSAASGATDKRRPRLLRVVAEPLGVRLVVDGSPVSAGVAMFLAQADKLRAGFRCRAVKVEPSTHHNVIIHLRYDDPAHFRRPIRVSDLPAPTRKLHVVVGFDDDSQPVEKDLRLSHLVIGASGAGKSSEAAAILHGLVESRVPFRLRVFDPKGGQEFGWLADAAWEYERDPTHWTGFLEHAHRALSARQAALGRAGQQKVTRYTVDTPLDVMLVDELLTALAFGANRKVKVGGVQVSAEDAFMLYLSTARAAGAMVLALAQMPQKEIIGKVRGLFGYSTCLRVAPTEKEAVRILLGDPAAYPAHELSADERQAGIGYTTLPRGVVRYRAAFLTDQERRYVADGVRAWTARTGRGREPDEATS